MKALVVGAGVSGLTAAVLLKRKGYEVFVLESRDHIGGNCWDHKPNNCDVYVHKYGPHIFHTSDETAWKFLNEFTSFNDYKHKVVASIANQLIVPIPYSKATEEAMGLVLSDEEIVNTFFKPYSKRMWGCPYEEIPSEITGRINFRRDDHNINYFTDTYQGMPSDGYAIMFKRMVTEIGSSNVLLGCGIDVWRSWAEEADLVVYTGMLDEFHKLEHDRLPYRAVEFIFDMHEQTEHAVVNYCLPGLYSRTTDFSRFYKDEVSSTILCTERPTAWNPKNDSIVPAYPMVHFPKAEDILVKYKGMYPGKDVVLCGRLGTYKYMNMDMAITNTIDRLEEQLGCKLY